MARKRSKLKQTCAGTVDPLRMTHKRHPVGRN